MKYLIFTLFFLLSACSGYRYRSPESIGEKMDRFRARNPNPNPVVKQKVNSKFLKRRSGRFLASNDKEYKKLEYSNKRLYFLSLLNQYHELQSYLPEQGKDVKVCAHFHSSLVDFNNSKKNIKQYKLKALKGEMTIASLYPEMSLKVSNDGKSLKDLETMEEANLSLHDALSNHSNNTWNELNELCEYGVSDNYYAFENLLTHIKNKGLLRSPEGAGILFKTTVYSNDLILSSLNLRKVKGRSPASHHSSANENIFLQELSKRMNTKWYFDYKDNLKNARN